MTDKPVADIKMWEALNRPEHIHTCTKGGHPWPCQSPYCVNIMRPCPDHGGPEPRTE